LIIVEPILKRISDFACAPSARRQASEKIFIGHRKWYIGKFLPKYKLSKN